DVATQTLAVYDLARFTGMRRSGIIGLRWDDVHLAATTPHLVVRQDRSGQTKSTSHTVPLIPDAVRILREQAANRPDRAAPDERLFGLDGRSFTQNVRRACNRAGIPPDQRATLHQQRHEFVSLAREAGVPDAVIREAIGHRDARALEGYTSIETALAGRLLSAAMPSTSSGGGNAGN
ncbi:Integrase, catalytic core, phage domain protein, partial [mine drainage metagenome]